MNKTDINSRIIPSRGVAGDAIYRNIKQASTLYNPFPAPIEKKQGSLTGVVIFTRDTHGFQQGVYKREDTNSNH